MLNEESDPFSSEKYYMVTHFGKDVPRGGKKDVPRGGKKDVPRGGKNNTCLRHTREGLFKSPFVPPIGYHSKEALHKRALSKC
ncbi:hypothetical protein POVWA2_003450 [Plasmodium ovale wallikeri]|uniref:Uncharacterized protein n=1 Tax=Plasmodium ovale wallikeri TaxID=864142 RepID=A0A1A8YID5_PLAOA|nr:hypothetical protein POVWA1_003260 [Plasmodium ovale wallikeri]SBT31303.1 hypothetical protein POVWA2_003450 [Plasmodium ovale wallikeri]